MIRPSPLLNVMASAVRKAARGLARDFGEVAEIKVARKGPADFVSAADHRAEQILFDELSKARPGYGFLMEERGAIEGTDKTHQWIVDPLDSTLNFLHGIGHFAISVGLKRDGEIVAGIVYDVAKDELFYAERGHGAYLNDKRLRVAQRQRLDDCVYATGAPFAGRPGHERFHAELAAITPKVAGVRRFGSAALDLAWVAAGRYDGYWERGIKAWDMAAGIVLVREAGGFVRDPDGAASPLDSGAILAGSEWSANQLQLLVGQS